METATPNIRPDAPGEIKQAALRADELGREAAQLGRQVRELRQKERAVAAELDKELVKLQNYRQLHPSPWGPPQGIR